MELQGLNGILLGQSIELAGPEVTVGRETGNTIVCSDSSVSRRHARLSPSGSGFLVEDLGSSNGTFVNGARISAPTMLESGDEVSFGDQRFRAFQGAVAAAPVASAAPPSFRPTEASAGEGYRPQFSGPGSNLMRGCSMPNFDAR